MMAAAQLAISELRVAAVAAVVLSVVPHRALVRFADEYTSVDAIQLVRECKAEADIGRIRIRDAASWLKALEI